MGTTGVKYEVTLYKNAAGKPVVENINFRGKLQYEAGFATTTTVKRDLVSPISEGAAINAASSVKGIGLNRYIVTTFYVVGEEPDLSMTAVNDMVSAAVTAINTAYPGEFIVLVPDTPLTSSPDNQ